MTIFALGQSASNVWNTNEQDFDINQWRACSGHYRCHFCASNPLDGTSATIAPAASVDDAVAAVAAAAATFREWSLKGLGERRKLLMKAAQALEARLADFAAAMAAETGASAIWAAGASAIWAGFNVHLAADMLLEAASLTTQIHGELIPSDLPGSLSMGVRQPAGVVPHPGTRRSFSVYVQLRCHSLAGTPWFSKAVSFVWPRAH